MKKQHTVSTNNEVFKIAVETMPQLVWFLQIGMAIFVTSTFALLTTRLFDNMILKIVIATVVFIILGILHYFKIVNMLTIRASNMFHEGHEGMVTAVNNVRNNELKQKIIQAKQKKQKFYNEQHEYNKKVFNDLTKERHFEFSFENLQLSIKKSSWHLKKEPEIKFIFDGNISNRYANVVCGSKTSISLEPIIEMNLPTFTLDIEGNVYTFENPYYIESDAWDNAYIQWQCQGHKHERKMLIHFKNKVTDNPIPFKIDMYVFGKKTYKNLYGKFIDQNTIEIPLSNTDSKHFLKKKVSIRPSMIRGLSEKILDNPIYF